MSRANLFKFGLISIFLLGFYVLLYKIYVPYTNSFGCFDECMNYGGGYFIAHGKQLYSQIFFNHQPNMGYLSYLIQVTTNPQNLYEFLLRHLQVTMLFGLIFNFLIIWRFKITGLIFAIIFELSKFYLFGNRFLAEAYIVYPMVYMTGLIWYKFNGKKIYDLEYIFSGLMTWFVVFSRETFVPVVIIQYFLILGSPKDIYKKVSIVIFGILSVISITILPLKEYLFSVTTLSFNGVVRAEVSSHNLVGLGALKIFLYPVFLLFGGEWNEFRILQFGISVVFIVSTIILLYQRKFKLFLITFAILALSNIRYVEPGMVFYAGYRMIPWFGMFILFTMLIISSLKLKLAYKGLLYAVFIGSFVLYLLQPQAFFKNPSDREAELLINYGRTIKLGETVRILSTPDQTFFINGDDSLNLAYWQSKRLSGYKYSWYVYFSPSFERYIDAKKDMIKNNPPDFFFGQQQLFPKKEQNDKYFSNYAPLYIEKEANNGLYIKKSLLGGISQEQWDKAAEIGVAKPIK